MEEIKIAKKSWIIVVGLISAIAVMGLGVFFWSLADEPHITSTIGVQVMSGFMVAVGVFTVVFVIWGYFHPKYLILNDKGIDNQTSFGFVAWDQISKVSRFEGTIGAGNYRSWAEGVLLELNERYKMPNNLNMLKRKSINFSAKKWGSPTVIYSSNWAWSQFEIEEKIQSYLTAHRNKSKGKK